MASDNSVEANNAWNLDVEGQVPALRSALQLPGQPIDPSDAHHTTRSDGESFSGLRQSLPYHKYSLATWLSPTKVAGVKESIWHKLSQKGTGQTSPCNSCNAKSLRPNDKKAEKAAKNVTRELIQGTVNVPLRQTPVEPPKHAGQRIFICVDHGPRRGQLAIQVPCLRPTEHRRQWLSSEMARNNGHMTRRVRLRKVLRSEKACESDAAIVERIQRMLERELGRRLALVPYYGVVKVEIVEVSISRHRQSHMFQDFAISIR